MQLQPSPRGDNSTSGMMKAVMFENEKVQIHRYQIVVSNVLSLIISTTSHVIQGETAFVLTTQWSTGICGTVIPCGIQGRFIGEVCKYSPIKLNGFCLSVKQGAFNFANKRPKQEQSR